MRETTVSILFGTQTGNSLGVAKRIQRSVIAKGYSSTVQCMNQWHHVNWKATDVAVFVTSSFGVGIAPDNADEFEAMLKESRAMGSTPTPRSPSSDCDMDKTMNDAATEKEVSSSSTSFFVSKMNQTHFAVLGLGHRLWPNFCAFPKFVDEQLEQLGGLRMVKRGDADDGHPSGRDAVVDPWIGKFLKKLTKVFPPSPTPKVPPPIQVPPPLSTPDIEDLSSLPLKRFSAQSPLANRLRKTPTARGTPRSARSPPMGDGAARTPVRSPMSFGSDLLCDTCHLDRQECSYECISETKEPELVHYNHPDCFEAPVVGATVLTRSPSRTSPVTKARSLAIGSPASPLLNIPGESASPMAKRPRSPSPISFKDTSKVAKSSTSVAVLSPTTSDGSYNRESDTGNEPLPEVIHFKLDLSQMRRAHFEPGDSIGIRCPNDIFAASFIFERLEVPPETAFRPADFPSSFPSPSNIPSDCTMFDALMFFVDVTHCLSDACLDDLVRCTVDSEESRCLEQLILTEHERAANGEKSSDPSSPLSLLEILRCFPSCKPTVALLYRHLSSTPLRPRFYSVASSPLKSECVVEFALSVTPRGVCSTYLRRVSRRFLRRRDCASASLLRLPIFIRPELKTHFRLPSDIDRPMIFIGAGTGVAPLRGMLLHLQELSKRKAASHPSADVCDGAHLGICEAIPAPPPPRWALFGFRHKDVDFLYKDDFESLQRDQTLSKMDVCFSRNKDFSAKTGSDIRYVQHALKLKSDELLEHLRSKRALFFVCGSRAMESAVRECFVDILANWRSGRSRIPLGETLAREKIQGLIQRLQYRAESWS